MNEAPSLRRVFAGYLRLRSPFNLAIDAVVVFAVASLVGIAVSYFEQSTFGTFSGDHQPPTRGEWIVARVFDAVYWMIYWSAFALFAFACARLIADRIAAAAMRGDRDVNDAKSLDS